MTACGKYGQKSTDITSGSSGTEPAAVKTENASAKDTDTSESNSTKSIPEEFVGSWSCEDYASDKETNTGFYAMYIKKNGKFSIYDQEAGNPGISGKMKNDTGSSVDCEFDMGDFDVPYCWELDSPNDTLMYEIEGDTLKLGHNDVWMIFHKDKD
jgi:hypothetical protein